MRGAPSFELRLDPPRATAIWRGAWEEPDALAYAEHSRNLMSQPGTHPVQLIVDANDLQHCNIHARGVLADLHHELRSIVARTAFIASSPRIRGLCLWIARVAGDEFAKVFVHERSIESWLRDTKTRTEEARHRMLPVRGRSR